MTAIPRFLSSLCVLTCSIVLVSAAELNGQKSRAQSPATGAGDQSPDVELLATVFQAIQSLQDHIRNRELSLVHNEELILNVVIAPFYNPTNALAHPQGVNRTEFMTSFGQLRQAVFNMHTAADRDNLTEVQALLPAVLERFEKFKALFPKPTVTAASALAEQFMCPMHSKVMGKRTDSCSKCGMELEQRVRVLPSSPAGGLFYEQSISMWVRADEPLRVGRPAQIRIRLFKNNGAPVLATDLIETHTERIHLLIVDGSLEDYQHEHPKPTQNRGEYDFDFTPSKPGSYRIWADVRPSPVGIQQYLVADIPATTAMGTLTNTQVSYSTVVDGLSYELIFARQNIRAGYPVETKLRITNADGTGFTSLEPLMATFAHLVGFNEDYQTVLHLHPKGPPITDPERRGGPELNFQFYALQPGFVRLFAQVQIGGQSKFAPFGLRIAP